MSDRILIQQAGQTRPFSLGGGAPLLNTTATPWAGIRFELHRMANVENVGETSPLRGDCGLIVILNGQLEFVCREGKRELSKVSRPGTVTFVDGQSRNQLQRIKGSGEAAALQFSPEWFHRLLLEGAPPDFGRRAPLPHDATVLSLTTAIRDEVARGAPTGRLFAESLSLALLSYTLDRIPPSRLSVRGHLPEVHCRRLRNYLLEHLAEDVSLDDLAALVGRGPRQFSTLFRQAFGTTPHRYLVKARLAEGARLLALGGADVSEIALRVGFCSQSHFTEAFRRSYGVTPRAYAVGRRATSVG
jgi:AraC-like DNA-binding protein